MGKARGRPRSQLTEEAILAAAYAQLEEHGYRGITMESVARRSGASKATLYRRWSSIGELLLDSLVKQSAINVPFVSTGDLESDLKALLKLSFKTLTTRTGNLLRSLMAEAQRDEAFKERFRHTFIAARRSGLRSLLDAAVSRGELPTDIDRELLIDLIYGTMWYRLLICHAPLDNRSATQLVDIILRLRKPDFFSDSGAKRLSK